ncbi:hypothetical protein GALMADRAFT_223643 [Galerina marginata CBS 339.88]|uniref:Uncharacterized protein n=1 Tax=Galerina marginata (strain CBS 339.88) TaxID=685588 RepID=A0A067TAT5_GALM3|nr:hypothetical protein GALMADRAFT_223643 [Galerina marginata CBS 339.88]
MKSFAPVAAAVVLFAASTVAAVEPLVISNSATATVCQPFTFTWTGGTPPYTLVCDHAS